jgi:hypothetical protein
VGNIALYVDYQIIQNCQIPPLFHFSCQMSTDLYNLFHYFLCIGTAFCQIYRLPIFKFITFVYKWWLYIHICVCIIFACTSDKLEIIIYCVAGHICHWYVSFYVSVFFHCIITCPLLALHVNIECHVMNNIFTV